MSTHAGRLEIERRLRVVEGALGIDLDSTNKCSGDPATCEADPCNTTRCPMANSYVQQLLNNSDLMTRRLTLLMTAFEEMEDHGILPKGVLRLAQAKLRLDEVEARLLQFQQPPIVCEGTEEAIVEARERYSRLLEEVRRANAPAQDGE